MDKKATPPIPSRSGPTQLLTTAEARARLHMGKTHFFENVAHGRIKVVRDGSRFLRVPEWAIEAYIRNHLE